MSAREPAKNPCGTCPYRRDVPSGVWASEEYEKLPPYDNETGAQPPHLFACHQADGRLCAGWVGCHDMDNSLAVRLGSNIGALTPEVTQAVLGYRTEIPLWASGAEAAEHGLAEVNEPSWEARRKIERLLRKAEERR